MNLKTLYELKEVLDFCGYHDTIVEDMTNRGIDLESLEDKVNHEQKEIEENVYPNLHGTELLNKENISLLGEEILQYFEKTLEEWDKGIIDYDKNTNQLFHNEGKIFSSDVIAWYEGGRTTEDLVKEYSDEKEVEEDREHQILLLLGHAVHLGWNIKHDDEGIYFHKTAPNGLELGVHFDAVHEQESVEEFLDAIYEYGNGEFLKDFDYGLVTGTIYGYPDKELRLSEDFEIWSKDGEYFGAYSKKDIMDKLDGLNAEKQKTLLINPNDYGKIIQDMVKVAKASDNHTWFLEPEEFLDKTYAQEDLDELSRDLQSIKEAGVHDMYSIVEMWDDWKEADEHGEPVATFHGAFLDLFAKEKSQSIDKNLISFNSCTFEINLDSKDNGEGCLKWHNYFLTDIHNKDHFYIIQIVQETGKEEPRFSLEKFEKEEGSKLYLGEWVELEDVIKNSSEIEMVQNKLIELSDKEIGIQNEEIKNIEDDFEELDEVEK